MSELTAEQIAQRALNLNLLDERQLESVWSECGTTDIGPAEFRNVLVRRELVTNYQLDKLLRGERTGFYYGDYKVLYLVGTGSFARVYRAVHKDDGRVVAVKVLRKRFADGSNPRACEQFLREGEMGTTLRHPNIVPIYEVHQVKRTYYIVMAFVEGQSLRDFVRIRKQLEPLEAAEVMFGIVSGLAHAAEKGITHRDLKLSNVLMSADGQPQLVDFGLAAAEGDDTKNDRAIDYAGLERATKTKKDDPRSDIYFAGCIYYQLLTGEPPLSETRDRMKRLSVARFRDYKPIRDLIPNLPLIVEKTVTRAMEFNPAERYQRQIEFLVDLQKVIKALKSSDVAGDEGSEENPSRKILLVESNGKFQDALRKALRKSGYRVLVMSDPQRVMQRFATDPDCADCVIISTRDIGSDGITLSNQLGQNRATQHVAGILLLGKQQKHLLEAVTVAERRVALTMPVRMAQLRAALNKLFSSAATGPTA